MSSHFVGFQYFIGKLPLVLLDIKSDLFLILKLYELQPNNVLDLKKVSNVLFSSV